MNTFTLLSLLLFITAAALWVRSYVATEWLVYQRTDPAKRLWWDFTLVSGSGLIYLSHPSNQFNADGLAENYRQERREPDGFWYLRQSPESHWSDTRFGFLFVPSDVSSNAQGTANFPRAFIPYWFVTLIAAVLPCIEWGRRRRHRTRLREHRCLACGYDLRATPGRCPECGTAPQPPDDLPMQRTATASSGAVE